MKLFILILFSLFYIKSKGQQDSKITFDSSNYNNLTINQTGIDSIQRLEISLKKSDSNNVNLGQKKNESVNLQNNGDSNLIAILTNTNTILGIFVALITITTLLYSKYKKRRNP